MGGWVGGWVGGKVMRGNRSTEVTDGKFFLLV